MLIKYDAIIIGAGLSGLVCANYLVNQGFKVLIIEKNKHPGGCCTSFIKDGFIFDAAAHTLGGMKENGPISRVLQELKIENFLLKRTNPSYILQINNYQLEIHNDFSKTVSKLRKDFINESKGIDELYKFFTSATDIALYRLKDTNFKDFLSVYIKNEKLKSIFLAPLLGNTGICPEKITAFTALKFYQQYVLDGGYHFEGGIQELPDLLLEKFQSSGGEILLSTTVEKILISKNTVEGLIANNENIKAKVFVSNIDAVRTFSILSDGNLKKKMADELRILRPTSSMFMVYIGLKENQMFNKYDNITHWIVRTNKISNIYINLTKKNCKYQWVAFRHSISNKTLQIFTIAPFQSEEFWKKNNNKWRDDLIKLVFAQFPNIKNSIKLILTANPISVRDWTGNYQGASCGWESTPDQFNLRNIAQKTLLNNLFLTGHWTTLTLGLPGVVNIGKSTAKLIINKLNSLKFND